MTSTVAAKVVKVVVVVLLVLLENYNHQELIQVVEVVDDRLALAATPLEVLEVEEEAMIHQWLTDIHLRTLIAKMK